MKLLNSQKDELFDIIENLNLSPSQFEFLEDQGNVVSQTETTTLSFKNTNFYFKFVYNNKNGHHSIFSPGRTTLIEEGFPMVWGNQIKLFNHWISYIIREINTPNKWTRLKKEIEEINFGFTVDEEIFSFKEYEELNNKINLLKSRINELGLSKDQVIVINNKLDFLIESAKTLSKFNWKSLFIGTIISITIQLSLTPENSKSLWELIKNIFHQLFLN